MTENSCSVASGVLAILDGGVISSHTVSLLRKKRRFTITWSSDSASRTLTSDASEIATTGQYCKAVSAREVSEPIRHLLVYYV